METLELYIGAWRRMGTLVVPTHKRRKAGAKRPKLRKWLHIISKSYMNSAVAAVNVRSASRERVGPTHVRGALEPPGRKDLYINAWRCMGALVAPLHTCRKAGARWSNTQKWLYIISKCYMKSEVVIVNARSVH